NPRLAVGHAGAEVEAGLPEHHHPAASHVLAAMIADALDNRRRAAVANREALADLACDEECAAGRAVEDRIAGNRLWLLEGRVVRRHDRDLATTHPLGDVVVRFAVESQPQPGHVERPEALSGASLE